VTEVVRAAGGVVWRRDPAIGGKGIAGVEVLLVHRPAYDDWTFPKGKNEPGEADEDAARREVEEETGLRCRLGAELTSVEYPNGERTKSVRYWAMTVESEQPRPPDHEVDASRWLAHGEAQVLLTYERDRTVLQSLLDVLKGV